jgi:dihydroflavonol-4-reductase
VKRALVIGGTGFVGLHVVDALLAEGVPVRATRRRRSFTVLLRRRPVELVHASAEDVAAMGRAMEGCDVVFMVGGAYPRYSLDRDARVAEAARGARGVCEAALQTGVKRLVFTSSTGLLDPAPPGRPADERDVGPQMPTHSVYRAMKWAAEREVDAARGRGLDVVTLIPGGCVGPGDVRVGTSAFLLAVVEGRLAWWVDGLAHVADVREVALAHLAAAKADHPTSRYCIPGHAIAFGDLLRLVARRYGGRVPDRPLGPAEARTRADREEREAAPHRRRVPMPRAMVDLVTGGQPISSARAERDLGFAPSSLEGALDGAHAWFRDNGYLAPGSTGRAEGASHET